jgi:hypothetical protein
LFFFTKFLLWLCFELPHNTAMKTVLDYNLLFTREIHYGQVSF